LYTEWVFVLREAVERYAKLMMEDALAEAGTELFDLLTKPEFQALLDRLAIDWPASCAEVGLDDEALDSADVGMPSRETAKT
jgi:hypothetical protein